MVVEELSTLRRDVTTVRASEEKFQQFVTEQFGMFATNLTAVRESGEKFQQLVVEELGTLRKDVTAVRADLAGLRGEVTEMKDIVEPLAKAFDKDAETITEHDRRIPQ